MVRVGWRSVAANLVHVQRQAANLDPLAGVEREPLLAVAGHVDPRRVVVGEVPACMREPPTRDFMRWVLTIG